MSYGTLRRRLLGGHMNEAHVRRLMEIRTAATVYVALEVLRNPHPTEEKDLVIEQAASEAFKRLRSLVGDGAADDIDEDVE